MPSAVSAALRDALIQMISFGAYAVVGLLIGAALFPWRKWRIGDNLLQHELAFAIVWLLLTPYIIWDALKEYLALWGDYNARELWKRDAANKLCAKSDATTDSLISLLEDTSLSFSRDSTHSGYISLITVFLAICAPLCVLIGWLGNMHTGIMYACHAGAAAAVAAILGGVYSRRCRLKFRRIQQLAAALQARQMHVHKHQNAKILSARAALSSNMLSLDMEKFNVHSLDGFMGGYDPPEGAGKPATD